MGCFSSKQSHQDDATHRAPSQQPTSATPTRHAVPSAEPVPRAKVAITDADKAKHKLKAQRDMLSRTIQQSTDVLARDLKLAAQLNKDGNKEGALVLLKRRKLVGQRIDITSAQLMKIEESLSTLEGAENLKSVLDAVEQSTKALDKLNSYITIERAETVMEESKNAIKYTEEVASVLAHVEDVAEMDDDELMKQIEDFERGAEEEVDIAKDGTMKLEDEMQTSKTPEPVAALNNNLPMHDEQEPEESTPVTEPLPSETVKKASPAIAM